MATPNAESEQSRGTLVPNLSLVFFRDEKINPGLFVLSANQFKLANW